MIAHACAKRRIWGGSPGSFTEALTKNSYIDGFRNDLKSEGDPALS